MRALALFSLASAACAFPYHGSLAGRSNAEIALFERELQAKGLLVGAQPPPPPQKDTSSKLVNDKAHPWKPLLPTDIRGPCPGLNTLASHGYLPRDGIATPSQIINAVQEGFNMGYDLATFVTYGAFLVDGNHLTNLLSIGHKTSLTGPVPPGPATVGGLNTHGVFEGDASMTRGDAFFGDNHSFNETLFQQFVDVSNKFGNGTYNIDAASELRFLRLTQSLETNPTFSFIAPRFDTAYAESTFPFAMFTDNGALELDAARGFFEFSRMPVGFKRREGPFGLAEIGEPIGTLRAAHPFPPGFNEGVGNYRLVDVETVAGCADYSFFSSLTVPALYPNPQGALRVALKKNLHTFYEASLALDSDCEELFPYGK